MFTLHRWPLAVIGLILLVTGYFIEPQLGLWTFFISLAIYAIGGRLIVMGVWMDKKSYIVRQTNKSYNRYNRGHTLFIIPLALTMLLITSCCSGSAPPPFYGPEQPPPKNWYGNQVILYDNFSTNTTSSYKITPTLWSKDFRYDVTGQQIKYPAYMNTNDRMYRNITSSVMNSTTNHTFSMDCRLPTDGFSGVAQYFIPGLTNRTKAATGHKGHFAFFTVAPLANNFVMMLTFYWTNFSSTQQQYSTQFTYFNWDDFLGATLSFRFTRNNTKLYYQCYRNETLIGFWSHNSYSTEYIDQINIRANSDTNYPFHWFYVDNLCWSQVVTSKPLAIATASRYEVYPYSRIIFDATNSKNYTTVNWTLQDAGLQIYNASEIWNYTFNYTGIYTITLVVYDDASGSDIDIITITVERRPTTVTLPEPSTSWIDYLDSDCTIIIFLIGIAAAIVLFATRKPRKKR
jgi:hypothetical protein